MPQPPPLATLPNETIYATFEIKGLADAWMYVTSRRVVAYDATRKKAPILSVPLRAITGVHSEQSGGIAQYSTFVLIVGSRDYEWTLRGATASEQCALALLALL